MFKLKWCKPPPHRSEENQEHAMLAPVSSVSLSLLLSYPKHHRLLFPSASWKQSNNWHVSEVIQFNVTVGFSSDHSSSAVLLRAASLAISSALRSLATGLELLSCVPSLPPPFSFFAPSLPSLRLPWAPPTLLLFGRTVQYTLCPDVAFKPSLRSFSI